MKKRLLCIMLVLIFSLNSLLVCLAGIGEDDDIKPTDPVPPESEIVHESEDVSLQVNNRTGYLIIDSDKNIVFDTLVTKATSSIVYRTKGWLIHMKPGEPLGCVGDQTAGEDYVYCPMKQVETGDDTDVGDGTDYVKTTFKIYKKDVLNAIYKMIDWSKVSDATTTVKIYGSANIGVVNTKTGTEMGAYNTLPEIKGAQTWKKPQDLDAYYDIALDYPIEKFPVKTQKVVYKDGIEHDGGITELEKKFPTKEVSTSFPAKEGELTLKHVDIVNLESNELKRLDNISDIVTSQQVGGILIKAYYSDGSESVVTDVEQGPKDGSIPKIVLDASKLTKRFNTLPSSTLEVKGNISTSPHGDSHTYRRQNGYDTVQKYDNKGKPLKDKSGKPITEQVARYEDYTCNISYKAGASQLGTKLNLGTYLTTPGQKFTDILESSTSDKRIDLKPNFNFILERPEFKDMPTVAQWRAGVPAYLSHLGLVQGLKPTTPRLAGTKLFNEEVSQVVWNNQRKYTDSHSSCGESDVNTNYAYADDANKINVPIDVQVKRALRLY